MRWFDPDSTRLARRISLGAAALAALTGCASFSPDGGFAPIQQTAQTHLDKQVRWARTAEQRSELDARVAELLAQPLTADAAVQVALFNNRELQAAFFELGVSEAELVQAGRLPNPGFSFGALARGSEREVERGVHFNLARLITLPANRRLETARFESVQRQVAAQMLGLAAEVRKAWVMAVAADESVRYMARVRDAADASAELARRMAAAGNWNTLNQAREQSFAADAVLNVARALRAQVAARERLTRLLGLWGGQTTFALPERLPDMPAQAQESPNIEQRAMNSRLDVQAARLDAQAMARNLGLNRTTRFINVFELGAVRNSSNEEPTQRGYEISVELPLFDWGEARIARAEALYMQSVNRAAQVAIDARSQVREAYLGYRNAFDVARHQFDVVLPLRRRISDETLLRYNGMLIGVFELLADTKQQIGAVNAGIEALRDFWLAEADLQMAMLGKPSMATVSGPRSTEPSAAAAH